jgi:hypothetical protein
LHRRSPNTGKAKKKTAGAFLPPAVFLEVAQPMLTSGR